jgi:hypothetical protein
MTEMCCIYLPARLKQSKALSKALYVFLFRQNTEMRGGEGRAVLIYPPPPLYPPLPLDPVQVNYPFSWYRFCLQPHGDPSPPPPHPPRRPPPS